MLKIGFLSDQFYPRTSADSEQIISSLSALGKVCDVTLFSSKYFFRKAVTNEEVETYYGKEVTFKLSFITQFPFIRGIEKLLFSLQAISRIRKQDFSLIYTRNIPIVISVLLFTSLPIIFESYRPWPSRNLLSRWFFTRISTSKRILGIILHSEYAARSFRKVGFNEEQLLIAHNAFDLSSYEGTKKSEVRADFDLPLDKLIVTYSGRVSEGKGLMRIFDLAKKFKDVLFLIVGSEKEGEIEKKAYSFENVRVLGWQNKKTVFSLLQASDVLYIPPTLQARDKAKNTVLPLKTFLYKAAGVAILAPDIEDIAEVLEDKETAFLVEADNFDEETSGLELLINDQDLRKRIGKKARAEMKNANWENRAQAIKSFIDERLASKLQYKS